MGLNHLLPGKLGAHLKKSGHGIDGLHHQHHLKESSQAPSNGSYRSIVYFCNWAIYGRKHVPQAMPVEHLTHILYAFAKPDPLSGEVKLSDPWADTDIKIWDESGDTGCLGAIEVMRRRNPNLKLLLSIGGWTYSSDLATAVGDVSKRKTFVDSSLGLLRKFQLDGIDIDWEYPQNDTQSIQYVELLRDLRLELDSEALRSNMHRGQFELSAACPAGPEQMHRLRVREMDQYLSFWNIMAYDFAGSWSQKTDFHSNLYGGQINADNAIKYYNPATKTLVVYDNPESIRCKAQYIMDNNLGGGMWWESSADKPVNETRSLIGAFSHTLGPNGLQQRPNCLRVGNSTNTPSVNSTSSDNSTYHFPQAPPGQ